VGRRPLPRRRHPPPTCGERLVNGGFETDLTGTWQILNPTAPIARVQSPVYEGQWAVRLGDLQVTFSSYATLWQRVSLDRSRATLSLWHLPQIRESGDRFYIGFRNARNEWIPLLVDSANTGAGEPVSLDLTPYVGQILTLTISSSPPRRSSPALKQQDASPKGREPQPTMSLPDCSQDSL